MVEEKFGILYQTFELEIDILHDKSKALNIDDIENVYISLYIFQPHGTDYDAYSNRLFHVRQDERTKYLEPLEEIIENLGISYNWDEYDLLKTNCFRCNICKSTQKIKK